MSLDNVRKFEERINGDEALQARLRELSDAFVGDKGDSKAVFEAVVAPLAAEVGLPHTYDDALEYVGQRGDEDLTAEEAMAVAAGGSNDFCLVIGFGDVAADSCVGGSSLGANACAGVGVGGLLS